MAAALMAQHADGRVRVRSAGSEPGELVNPAVVEAMAEMGIDLSSAVPRRLDDEDVRESDVVVTMGCGDACPVYPGKRYLDWELPDHAGRSLDEVRRSATRSTGASGPSSTSSPPRRGATAGSGALAVLR
jgi:protein-tyrosine-phosphatase